MPDPNATRPLSGKVGAVVPDGGEVVGGCVQREPLLDRELQLGAGDVGPRGGDLDIVAVPSVMWARAIRGQVHGADGGAEARAAAAEDIEVAPLEVVVTGRHQPSPSFQVRHVHQLPVHIIEPQADDRVRPALEDRAGPDVHRVDALLVILHHHQRGENVSSIDLSNQRGGSISRDSLR